MRLFIAEKPSLARAIAAKLAEKSENKNGYLDCGNDIVTWCFGHLLELAEPHQYNEKYQKWKREDLPILPNKFLSFVKKDKGAKAQLEIIGKLLKKASLVVNAGDPDREGQLLVDEVLEYHGYTGKCERIWLASLDDKSIKKALSTLKDNAEFGSLRDAARGRSQADWIVGFNATRAMTLACQSVGGQGVFSLGRVQTPTLALVVKRDAEIQDFKSQPYFTLQATCNHKNNIFVAVFQTAENMAGTDNENHLIDKTVAEKIKKEVKGLSGEIIEMKTEPKKKNPPLPHCLSSLQKIASSKYGMTAKSVLDIAQSLYEKKMTTYPRTDCRFLPEEQFSDAETILSALKNGAVSAASLVKNTNSQIKSSVWNTERITAHHAIIPTGETDEIKKLSKEELQIFDLIVESYCVQFYLPLEYESQKIQFKIADTLWKATGCKILQKGWTEFLKPEAKNENEEENQSLPNCLIGEKVDIVDVHIQAKKTQPPARFTEGTLIDAMSHIHKFVDDSTAKKTLKENEGIGTEATRANILEELKAKGFLKEQKKNLVSTEKGQLAIKYAPQFLTDPITTAYWEARLTQIVKGQETLENFMNDIQQNTIELVQTILLTKIPLFPGTHLCPECDKPIVRKKNEKTKNWYWACFNKEAHNNGKAFFMSDDNGKPKR